MSTTFQFTVDADGTFPNRKVALDRFEKEIRDSAITVALDSVTVSNGNCIVTFKADLSSSEVLTLEQLVFSHSGEPLVPDIQAVQVYTQAGTPQPVAMDGKPFVLPNIFPGEVLLNFTGSSDKLSPPQRFGGALFGLQQSGVGTASMDIDFLDGVFLAGGHVDWTGGSWGSSVYMELVAPASTVKEPATPGHGNCNLVPTGLGFNIIVPAAGNGAKDIDVAVPVPAYDDETNVQNGYWSYSEPWLGKGTLSPSPGNGKYNLFDVPLELAHFAKLHLHLDKGQRDLVAPSIKPKWILPEWKMRVTIDNKGTGTLSVSWDLLIARRKSV
jgi:hypothetical protein